MAFTYFFRDMPTMEIITQHVISAIKEERHLDIWDAGCANGAEPYTLAILLKENMGQFMFRKVHIYATDLNPQFDEVIAKGVYAADEVGRIPAHIMQTYFTPGKKPDTYILDEEVRRRVTFEAHDLTTLKPIRKDFGLILCKNVLLHLSPAQRIDVFKMFYDVLCPGGYLGVEQTQKLPDEAREWFRPVSGIGPVFQRI
ncbi:MAG: chemotaxis protein CheR [Armatimonadetes bacterium]|nr:chemotaxis protein CheR [Armatimonadota bacterium]